jgi:hypothetical protein
MKWHLIYMYFKQIIFLHKSRGSNSDYNLRARVPDYFQGSRGPAGGAFRRRTS